jgi:hypothetical protein
MSLTDILLLLVGAALVIVGALQVACWRTLLSLRDERDAERTDARSWAKAVLGHLHWELVAAIEEKRRPNEGVLYALKPWLYTQPLEPDDRELLHRLHHLHNALKQHPQLVERESQAVIDQLERMLGYRPEVTPGMFGFWVD